VMSVHHDSVNVYHVAVEKIFHDNSADKIGLMHPVSEECVNVHLGSLFSPVTLLVPKEHPSLTHSRRRY
jgi:hypothetical protein